MRVCSAEGCAFASEIRYEGCRKKLNFARKTKRISMKIECLRTDVKTGNSNYPIYIGFARADDIARVSAAPSFTISTSNQQIAHNLTAQPVRDWQRPIDTIRVGKIAETFDNTGALMPNPVLLARNAFVNGGVTISPKSVQGFASGTYIVKIDEAAQAEEQRPLWILDGQHRISGLSQSLQADNTVPLVLLLNDAAGLYTSPMLANIFAQVTTAATKLDDLHNEWLTYAFKLGKYASNQHARHAFATVVELCRTSAWGAMVNPFFNEVLFNEHSSAAPAFGGFAFRCNQLSEIILRNYYNFPAQIPHLDPPELARELSASYTALHQTILNHNDSVYFGDAKKQQAIVQEAFLVGVLARTLANGPTASYPALLQGLNFQHTNWNFSLWTRSLSGKANTVSKKIAVNVFADAMASGSLPSGSNNLADHLRGNGAAVTLCCSALTPAGRPTKKGRSLYTAQRGSTGSHNVAATRHIRIDTATSNVGEVQVVDAHAKGRAIRYEEIERRGLKLEPPVTRPLDIIFIMQHYGELYSQAEVQLNW